MTLFRRLLAWLTTSAPDRVSASWLKEQVRYESTRGVDLPRWRTPKERGL